MHIDRRSPAVPPIVSRVVVRTAERTLNHLSRISVRCNPIPQFPLQPYPTVSVATLSHSFRCYPHGVRVPSSRRRLGYCGRRSSLISLTHLRTTATARRGLFGSLHYLPGYQPQTRGLFVNWPSARRCAARILGTSVPHLNATPCTSQLPKKCVPSLVVAGCTG